LERPQCAHCGLEIPHDAEDVRFCCRGCHVVHDLLLAEGLGRYYTLDRARAPVPEPGPARELAWLDDVLAVAEARPGDTCAATLDLAGVRCAACVWLIETLLRRDAPRVRATVNPALGKVELAWARGDAPRREALVEIERFGYRFGPDHKRPQPRRASLTLRLGICAALTINVMLFTVSFYGGLAASDPLYPLFGHLVLALSTLVVAIGGSVFFAAALRGLRARVLHLDLPIAVGIALAYTGSLLQLRAGRGHDTYLDTLCVFVTLMLLGRLLQERLIERNRRLLLEDDAIDQLTVRRQLDDRLEAIPVTRVVEGDRLLVAPTEIVPVDLTLADERAAVTTDWITGEPDVRACARGELVPAGACNAGRSAFTGHARQAFADSLLPTLLRAGGSAEGTVQAYRRLWARFARIYVLAVLGAAAATFALWWSRAPGRAVDVTVALLVVTCPCAIGIAGPLAYELVLGRLRRRGLFVRTGNLLDKLTRVRKVLFDKTGTLTLGALALRDPDALDVLSPAARDAAYTMASRSNHPASRCLAAALMARGARSLPGAIDVIEDPGRGLAMSAGASWRLGSAAFALGETAGGGGTVLARDGVAIARFPMREALRADAPAAIARLHALGCEVHLLSGDAPARVAEIAAQLGIPPERVRAGLSPVEKAWRVDALDEEDTLFVGDGVNDALAFERALVAGTPAIDRPVLPGKSDFFLLGDGVTAIADSLTAAHRLRAIVGRNLAIAIAYNTLAVTACVLGLMTPLRAAVAMPLSSLGVLGATVYSLSEGRWRS
jgi:Cu2+-exporting ATPase